VGGVCVTPKFSMHSYREMNKQAGEVFVHQNSM